MAVTSLRPKNPREWEGEAPAEPRVNLSMTLFLPLRPRTSIDQSKRVDQLYPRLGRSLALTFRHIYC
jgi:hypothetical protein